MMSFFFTASDGAFRISSLEKIVDVLRENPQNLHEVAGFHSTFGDLHLLHNV